MTGVLAAVLLAQAAQQPADIDKAVLGFADHLLSTGEAHRAIGEYERYLWLCGDCEKAPYAELRLAEAQRRAGQVDEAIARYRVVIGSFPGKPEARDAAMALPETLEAAGRPGDASDAYRFFVTTHGADADAPELAVRALRTALRAHDVERLKLGLPLVPAGATTGDLAALVRAAESGRPSRRVPAVAGTLAVILPGAGHAYAGRYRDAITSFIINALFTSGAVIAWQQEQYAIAGVLGGLEIFWYGGNVVGAVNAAHRFNAAATDRHWRELEKKFIPVPAVSLRF